jgi:hypothetical protein
MYKASEDEIRVATVTATGERYLVQTLNIGATPEQSRCHCWGHVTSYRGLSSKHDKSKAFRLDAVKIDNVRKSPALLDSLLRQYIESLRKQGYVIRTTRGGNYKIVAYPPQSLSPM